MPVFNSQAGSQNQSETVKAFEVHFPADQQPTQTHSRSENPVMFLGLSLPVCSQSCSEELCPLHLSQAFATAVGVLEAVTVVIHFSLLFVCANKMISYYLQAV